MSQIREELADMSTNNLKAYILFLEDIDIYPLILRAAEDELEARRLDEYHTDLMNTAWDYPNVL